MPAPLNEVSTRATAPIIEILERWGEPVDGLAEGLPRDLDFLRNPRRLIEWDDLARFLDNVQEVIGPDRLHALGVELNQAPSWEWPRRFARVAVGPRALFKVGVTMYGPTVFPCVKSQVDHLPDGRIRVELTAPEGGRPSLPWFQITRAHLQTFPRLLGGGDATMEAEVHPRRGVYLVTLPATESLFDRATAVARTVLRAPLAINVLTRQQDELRRSYYELARSRRELEQVLSALPVGLGMHRNGVCVYANEALARIMGYDDPATLVGIDYIEHVHPEDRHEIIRRVKLTERERAGMPPAEVRFLKKDGSAAVVETTAMGRIEYGGMPADVVIVRDLTKERRLREQLMLADRMASLGTLAAGVAHEINNPLTYLRGSLDIIDRELDRLDEPEPRGGLRIAREALRAAVDGAKRVSTIVGDLRTFSRPSDEPLQRVDVDEVIDSTLRVAAKQVRSRARVVRDHEPVPQVMASPARLSQVFLNLILNAAQALPEGYPEEHEIVVRTRALPRDRVAIEIVDSGVGIPADKLSRIFDPFFTTKHGVGTGLGLPISHSIVTRLGGTIEVESREGVGTTMRVLLPAAETRRTTAHA